MKSADVIVLPRHPAKRSKNSASTLEKALFTPEEWLRLVAEGSQSGLWYWNEVTRTVLCDTRTRDIFGISHVNEVRLKTFCRSLHRDDLARVKQTWRYQLESGHPYKCQFRIQRPDGSIRWVDSRGVGYHNGAGRPLYMIGAVFDITERKEIERERMELRDRIINSQEQEQRRIAQELHDDFGQRLSLLHIELQAATGIATATEVRKRVFELVGNLSAIVDDLQSLSHRLHPSKLELGLVPSLHSLCEKFAKQHGIEIEFDYAGLPQSIPPETTMSLFRIVQEGLHNVSKHSHASKVNLHLNANSHTISLTMFDNGKGFKVTRGYSQKGLGIQSMQERARSLHGSLEIRSRPSVKGTEIAVTVPLEKAA